MRELLQELDQYHHREWIFVEDIQRYRHAERRELVETREPPRYDSRWAVRLTPAGRRLVREPKVDGRQAHLHRRV